MISRRLPSQAQPHAIRSRLAVLACLGLSALLLAACTTVDYTAFEYRTGSKIIEGEGGSKRLVDGIEIWDAGDPPHRYRILGMIRVSDYDQFSVNTSMLNAVAQQTKLSGGSAAILLTSSGGMRSAVNWHERLGTPEDNGYRVLRALVVQYLPDLQEQPASAVSTPFKTKH